jgi:hypothetical protein
VADLPKIGAAYPRKRKPEAPWVCVDHRSIQKHSGGYVLVPVWRAPCIVCDRMFELAAPKPELQSCPEHRSPTHRAKAYMARDKRKAFGVRSESADVGVANDTQPVDFFEKTTPKPNNPTTKSRFFTGR